MRRIEHYMKNQIKGNSILGSSLNAPLKKKKEKKKRIGIPIIKM